MFVVTVTPRLSAQESKTPQVVPPLPQTTSPQLPNPLKTTGLSDPLLSPKETITVVIKPDPTIEIQKSIEALKPPPKPKKK